MANNLVVQLLLKTGTFSTDLKKAGGQVQQFKKGCDTAGKSVSAFSKALGVDVGMLTKFGGAVGAAVVAGKAMKAMIDSNQTSADAFQGVLYGCKTAVGEFAYAISTFDFTNFNDGLSGLIQRARDAYAAIDQLGNTLGSYSLKEAKARAAVANARKVQRDKNATQEEKEAATQAARKALEEARTAAEVAIDDYTDTMVAQAKARGAQLSKEGALDILDYAMELNATRGREAAKAQAEADYNAYVEAYNKVRNAHTVTTTVQSNIGAMSMSTVDENSEEYKRDIAVLNQKYEKSVAVHTILVKMSDEERKTLEQERIAMYGLSEQLDTMDSRLEGVENRVNGTTGATKKQEEAVKGSLEDWTKVAAEAKKTRDSVEFGTQAWEEANKQLKEAEKNIERINMLMSKERYKDLLAPITPVTPVKTPLVTDTSNGGGLAGTQGQKSINELEHEAKKLEENLFNLKPGLDDKAIEETNKRLAEIAKKIQIIKNLGLPNLSADKKAADSWDHINEALENTSTIMTNLMDTFQEGTKVTASSILRMVSTSLPAVYQLATAIMALAGIEATAKAVETSQHWVEAIAAVAALGSVVAAALSTAKSQKFAGGGIVGGDSYSGDRVTAQVNSGEMILNRAQQANLFKMINNGVSGSNQVEFHISGTDLVGVLNNQTRKSNLIR